MRVTAFSFHDVVENDARGVYTLDLARFQIHLGAIQHAATDRTSIILTFDDGRRSAYTCVAKELERIGRLGYFFVTTDWVGRPGFLSREEIRDLHERGHVIGSHSCTHPERMSRLRWDDMVKEWSRSRAVLTDIIGRPVVTASVPGGYYSSKVARAAAACGFEVLFTSEPTSSVRTVDGCVVLGRYPVRRNSQSSAIGAVARGARWPRTAQAVLWSVLKTAKWVTGGRYQVIRGFLLSRSFHY